VVHRIVPPVDVASVIVRLPLPVQTVKSEPAEITGTGTNDTLVASVSVDRLQPSIFVAVTVRVTPALSPAPNV